MNYEIKRPLMKVIDKCLLDHAAAVGTKEGGPDIEDVYRLQNLSKIHYYLKEDHDFLADEVAALLQFTDPLTVALECWKEQDHPWEFPICDILYAIKAYERFPLVNPAGYAQQKVDQIQSLKDRLDRNISSRLSRSASVKKRSSLISWAIRRCTLGQGSSISSGFPARTMNRFVCSGPPYSLDSHAAVSFSRPCSFI